MKQFHDAILHELVWRQSQVFARQFELVDSGECLATLEWRQRIGTLADGVTADGAWTLKRVGVFKPRITVRVAGTDTDLMVYESRSKLLGPGVFQCAEGHLWAADYLGTTWEFRTARDEVAMRLQRHPSMRLEGALVLTEAARSFADLSIHVLVGWYLYVLLAEENSAGAIAHSDGPGDSE